MPDKTVTDCSTLLKTLRDESKNFSHFLSENTFSDRTLHAIECTPREKFILSDYKEHAYANQPLPIGHRQTISQPFIVALMTDLLAVGKNETVLEIGTGSGYQAAVLSCLCKHVYSVEVVPELAKLAQENIAKCDIHNVSIHTGNGYNGWAEHAPYNAIIITAAIDEVPPALIDQLAPEGRLIVPEGSYPSNQMLRVYNKTKDNRVESKDITPVAFVPFVKE